MARFSALDLATLPDPSAVVPLDFEAILAARLDDLEARLAERFSAAEVAEVMGKARALETSPTRYIIEAGAAREVYLRGMINDAVRSVFLATATGGDLDQLGAGRGVVRAAIGTDADGGEILEGDAAFRARIQLAIEAYSPHGSEGSYVYWALASDDRVRDVVVYGPEAPLDPPLAPAEPLMVVLSHDNAGVASAALLEAVRAYCTADKRRPIGDKLTVRSADPMPYGIEAVLHVASEAAAGVVQAAAEAAVAELVAERTQIGRRLYRSTIAAVLKVAGVVDVELISPSSDLVAGPFEAPRCDSVAITTAVTGAGWRNV